MSDEDLEGQDDLWGIEMISATEGRIWHDGWYLGTIRLEDVDTKLHPERRYVVTGRKVSIDTPEKVITEMAVSFDVDETEAELHLGHYVILEEGRAVGPFRDEDSAASAMKGDGYVSDDHNDFPVVHPDAYASE